MRKLFEDAGTWPRELVLIADEGASFDEHYNHAFAQAWERGADAVLSMGADMPALTTADVIGGFEALHRLDGVPGGGIVLAPDQEMGVSIVGWTRATAFDHAGVFYNQEGLTVLPAYIAKARERNLPALYLPAVPDVTPWPTSCTTSRWWKRSTTAPRSTATRRPGAPPTRSRRWAGAKCVSLPTTCTIPAKRSTGNGVARGQENAVPAVCRTAPLRRGARAS